MCTVKHVVFAVALFLAACQSAPQAKQTSSELTFDPLVVVVTQFPFATGSGNGFAIGDGSLVVTASHELFDHSEEGAHRMRGSVQIVSPYLGEVCDARIVALHEEADLAVLETPWEGHPSYAIAEDKDLMSAERLLIAARPDIGPAMDGKTDKPMEQFTGVRTQNLAIHCVDLLDEVPSLITLAEAGELRKGWSGGPMLLPETSQAVGCFTQVIVIVQVAGELKTVGGARGPALAQIRHVVEGIGGQRALDRESQVLEPPRDARDAFLLYLSAIRHAGHKRYALVLEDGQAFLRLRPESVFGCRAAANAAAKLGKYELAESLYGKALATDPKGTTTRLMYAGFLADRGNTEEALGLLERIWEEGDERPWVAFYFFNVLFARGEYDRCGEYLKEALKEEPRNAYLWVNLGACQVRMKDKDAAISSYARAVELMPERGPFRGALAQLLEMMGRFDEAEKHFRRLLEIESENPVVYFWLAQFLAKHRPDAAKEAIELAETALHLPERRGLSRQKIRDLLRRLQARGDAEQ